MGTNKLTPTSLFIEYCLLKNYVSFANSMITEIFIVHPLKEQSEPSLYCFCDQYCYGKDFKCHRLIPQHDINLLVSKVHLELSH